MKTMIYWTEKRCRKPKMQGTATANMSAALIHDMIRYAAEGKGTLHVVTAPTANHGRAIIDAFKRGDIDADEVYSANERAHFIGHDARNAALGSRTAVRDWDAHIARRGAVPWNETRALRK